MIVTEYTNVCGGGDVIELVTTAWSNFIRRSNENALLVSLCVDRPLESEGVECADTSITTVNASSSRPPFDVLLSE